jgi:acyl transferase domain-containing protein
MVVNLKLYLSEHAELDQETLLDDLAYTLFSRRSKLPYRVSLTASTTLDLLSALDVGAIRCRRVSSTPRLGFVFTGQGAQWHAMGRELIDAYPVFRASLLKAENCYSNLGAQWSLLGEFYRMEIWDSG